MFIVLKLLDLVECLSSTFSKTCIHRFFILSHLVLWLVMIFLSLLGLPVCVLCWWFNSSLVITVCVWVWFVLVLPQDGLYYLVSLKSF